MVATAEYETSAVDAGRLRQAGPEDASAAAPGLIPLARVLQSYSAEDARFFKLATDGRLASWLNAHWDGALQGIRISEAAPPASAIKLQLSYRGQPQWLALDAVQMAVLRSVAKSGPHEAAPALRTAVAARLVAPLLQTLAALGLADVDVTPVEAGMPSLAPGQRLWRVDVYRTHGTVASAWLPAPARIWLDGVADAALGPRRLHAHELPGLRLPGRLLLGARRLKVQVLNALRPGDVLLRAIEAQAPILQGQPIPCTLRWARAETPGARYRLQTPVLIEGTHMTLGETPAISEELHDDIPDPDAPETAAAIGEVEVPLQVELAAQALTIAQVAELRAGQILELPSPVRDAQVRLTVFGQTVAFGELVCVGEHLGVRIQDVARS